MGHSSSRAALLYQHATRERELAIGRRLSERIEEVRVTGVDASRSVSDGGRSN
jgi:hypothetical protein